MKSKKDLERKIDNLKWALEQERELNQKMRIELDKRVTRGCNDMFTTEQIETLTGILKNKETSLEDKIRIADATARLLTATRFNG